MNKIRRKSEGSPLLVMGCAIVIFWAMKFLFWLVVIVAGVSLALKLF